MTDELVIEAAEALAAEVRPDHLELRTVCPPSQSILQTSLAVAPGMVMLIVERGFARPPTKRL